MTSSVMTRARRPGMAMGMAISTVALRPTSPLKTSSTCSLAVASHPVSPPPPSPQPGLTRVVVGDDASLSLSRQPPPDSAPLIAGNVHVYSNGRMRYNYQQRQDRRENQGDVSEEVLGAEGGRAWSGQWHAQLSILHGRGPTTLSRGAILGLPCHSSERHQREPQSTLPRGMGTPWPLLEN